jgi:hypothetical protein
VLRGREVIAAWIENVCGRETTHRVEHLEGGRIARRVAVQAWDE